MRSLMVNLDERSYPINFSNSDDLDKIGKTIEARLGKTSAIIVSDSNVAPIYLDKLHLKLSPHFNKLTKHIISAGEEYKTFDTVIHLLDLMTKYNIDRHCALIALGGGVIGDIVGFAASIYMRGIPFVQIPTTLLSQVDSSIGGKTGVNHSRGKNLIGSFYQPSLVWINTNFLNTLPQKEFLCGIAEILKAALIKDIHLFQYLDKNTNQIYAKNAEALLYIIEKSCTIKKNIIELDEREKGLRQILNFGHTFGHALEVCTQYKKYSHGEAVSIGIIKAIELSIKNGFCSENEMDKITSLINKLGLPTKFPKIDNDLISKAISIDKKKKGQLINFVFLNKIGQVQVRETLPKDILSPTD